MNDRSRNSLASDFVCISSPAMQPATSCLPSTKPKPTLYHGVSTTQTVELVTLLCADHGYATDCDHSRHMPSRLALVWWMAVGSADRRLACCTGSQTEVDGVNCLYLQCMCSSVCELVATACRQGLWHMLVAC